jgi:hypothetical protein
MAKKAKKNTNRGRDKQSHAEKTMSALSTVRSGTNLNASLINPKITPTPRSTFSSLFRTKGTSSRINKDVLFREPTRTDAEYAPTRVPERIAPSSLRSARRVDPPLRPTPGVHQEGSGREARFYQLDPIDNRTILQNNDEILRVTQQNTAKRNALTTAQSNWQRDMGVRRTARSRSKASRGGEGRNGVL